MSVLPLMTVSFNRLKAVPEPQNAIMLEHGCFTLYHRFNIKTINCFLELFFVQHIIRVCSVSLRHGPQTKPSLKWFTASIKKEKKKQCEECKCYINLCQRFDRWEHINESGDRSCSVLYKLSVTVAALFMKRWHVYFTLFTLLLFMHVWLSVITIVLCAATCFSRDIVGQWGCHFFTFASLLNCVFCLHAKVLRLSATVRCSRSKIPFCILYLSS